MDSLVLNYIPSAATLFSTYASITATFTLFKQAYYQIVPEKIRTYLYNTMKNYFFKPEDQFQITPSFTLVIEYGSADHMFTACETYLCNKLKDRFNRLKIITYSAKSGVHLNFRIANELTFDEEFQGVELTWKYICKNNDDGSKLDSSSRYFELTFPKDHKPMILNSYLPTLIKTVEDIRNQKRVLKLWTAKGYYWERVNLNHPFTFEKLAMDPEEKKMIMDDLDRFVERKEFYKRVGKAWKRGYLLYGPPGTGKSSLVAAMANYLRFDVYDLQLASVSDDEDLRTLMTKINNKSILVVEDIDCSMGFPSRTPPSLKKNDDDSDSDSSSDDSSSSSSDDDDSSDDGNNYRRRAKNQKISLSALLNFIDGIWSSCADERIIVFTTNHKERLDPALLRPGRMDMHVNMSYMNMPAFKILASNYLLIQEHPLFDEIEKLIGEVKVTPAQAAEALMRSEDVGVALEEVIKLLRGKLPKNEDNNNDDDKNEENKDEESTENEGSLKKRFRDFSSQVFCLEI